MQLRPPLQKRFASSPAGLGKGVVQATILPAAVSGVRLHESDEGSASHSSAPEKAIPSSQSLQLPPPGAKSHKKRASLGAMLRPSQTPLNASADGLGAHQRSVSAPELGAHIEPRLGRVQGVSTDETTEELFAHMQRAHSQLLSGDASQFAAARFDEQFTRDALLQRNSAQRGSLQSMTAAPVARALETIMADETLRQIPTALLKSMNELSSVMARQLHRLTPEQADRVLEGAIEEIQKEHPRPWGHEVPLLAKLAGGKGSLADNRAAVSKFLRSGAHDSHSAMGAMVINKALFLGMKAAGLDSTVAPWLKDADREYMAHIINHKGNVPENGSETFYKDAVVGITSLHAASPIASQTFQPAVRPSTRRVPNLDKKAVQDAVRFGNPHVAGVSGSTNMFLHAASYFNSHEGSKIDATALTTLLAAQLCYDGGHSIHETLAVGHLLQSLPNVNLSAFQGYHPGHARGTYVELASHYGVDQIMDNSFARLLRHFEDHKA